MLNYPVVPLLLFIFTALLSVLLAVCVGSTPLPLQALFSTAQSGAHEIFFHLRLPRALTAFTTGGLLALSGCVLQILLRNPLADPYILGISGGASVAAMCALLLGFTDLLSVSAFLGSLFAMCLVSLLSLRAFTHERLLLVGVILAATFSAIMSFLLSVSDNENLRHLLFWLMGDINTTHMPLAGLSILLIGLGISLLLTRALNVLRLGEPAARALGINTHRLHYLLYFLSSLLTATAVTLAGPLGFVGLIIPHLLRLMGLHDHRILLPGSVLLGGSLVCVADVLSRTLIAPLQCPVGVTMAFIGLPVFLILLLCDKRSC